MAKIKTLTLTLTLDLQGLRKWRVRDKNAWYDTWDKASVLGYKLDPTMFPCPEKAALPLERCMRILPHQQDTGGFFVAVLQKVSEVGPFDQPDMSHR